MESLKAERRWCIWRKIVRDGKPTKVPFMDASTPGRSDDPQTWLLYNEAEALRDQADGLGIYLSTREGDDGVALCGIDVDAHHTDEGVNPFARITLDLFKGTYAEKSPSGTGIHILFFMDFRKLPYGTNLKTDYKMKNSERELEIYIGGNTNRFLTITGDQVSEGSEVTDQTAQALIFLNTHMRRTERRLSGEAQEPIPVKDVNILERLRLARQFNGGRFFAKLYDEGNVDIVHGDHSSADWALVCKLCYWLNKDKDLIDQAFRGSRLYRDKWDESRPGGTYGSVTIDKAIDECEEFYVPQSRQTGSFEDFRKGLARFTAEDYLNSEAPAQYLVDYCDHSVIKSRQLFGWLYADIGEKFKSEGKDNYLEAYAIVVRVLTRELGTFDPHDSVLNLIHAAAESDLSDGKLAVLPFLCGTGKSTAVTYLIAQCLARYLTGRSTDGLLIVTDKRERMEEYIDFDRDEEIKKLFAEHKDLYTIVDSDSKAESLAQHSRGPVFIMTTHRFFDLSREEIQSYLIWDQGRRPLVIIDEKPFLLRVMQINETLLNDIDSALTDGISNLADRGEKTWCLAQWKAFKQRIHERFVQYENEYPEKPGYFLYHTFERKTMTDDDERFMAFIEDNRAAISNFNHGVHEQLRAIRQLMRDGGLYHCAKYGRYYDNSFYVVLNNREKVTGFDAKFIVLDGTGDLSPEYMQDYVALGDCDKYWRRMDNLTIKFVDIPTSRQRLQKDKGKNTSKAIRAFLDSIAPEGKKIPIFTYKEQEAFFNSDGERKTAHHGDTKGRNDFREENVLAQEGILRLPPPHYLALSIAMQPGLVKALASMSREEQIAWIEKYIRMTKGNREVMIPMLMADLEQALFRGAIRSPDSIDPYTYYVFCDADAFADLIDLAWNRYRGFGGSVEVMKLPEEIAQPLRLSRAMGYRWGGETHLQSFMAWYNALPSGTRFKRKQILSATGLNSDQFKKLKAKRALKHLLQRIYHEEGKYYQKP